ncbi:hypothetical protein M8C21_015802, partial [Ambrosia artemisiifolia]
SSTMNPVPTNNQSLFLLLTTVPLHSQNPLSWFKLTPPSINTHPPWFKPTPPSEKNTMKRCTKSFSTLCEAIMECHLAKLNPTWTSREEEEDDVSKSLRHFKTSTKVKKQIFMLEWTSKMQKQKMNGMKTAEADVLKNREDISSLMVKRDERNGFKAILLAFDTPKIGRTEADVKTKCEVAQESIGDKSIGKLGIEKLELEADNVKVAGVYWWYQNDDICNPFMIPPKAITKFWNAVFAVHFYPPLFGIDFFNKEHGSL